MDVRRWEGDDAELVDDVLVVPGCLALVRVAVREELLGIDLGASRLAGLRVGQGRHGGDAQYGLAALVVVEKEQ